MLILVTAAQFILTMDTSLLNVALPRIQHTFALTPQSLQWPLTAYLLPYGCFMLIGGETTDVFGTRPVFVLGTLLFTLAALVATAAPSIQVLLIGRALQGCGGAFMAPASLEAATRATAAGRARNHAFGAITSVLALGLVAGTLIGGALTALGGWRLSLALNVPLGLMLALPALLVLPRAASPPQQFAFTSLLHAAVIASCLASLLFALTQLPTSGGIRILPYLSFALVLASLTVVLHRRYHALPLTYLSSLNPLGRRTLLSLLLATGALSGVLYFLTLYLQEALHYTPFGASLRLCVVGAACALGSGCATGLLRVVPAQRLAVAGITGQALGIAVFSIALPRHDTLLCLGGALLAGFTYVLALTAGMVTVTVASQSQQLGIQAAIVNAAIEVGAAVGLGVLAAAASFHIHTLSRGGDSFSLATLAGMRRAGLVAALALCLVAPLLAFAQKRPPANHHFRSSSIW